MPLKTDWPAALGSKLRAISWFWLFSEAFVYMGSLN